MNPNEKTSAPGAARPARLAARLPSPQRLDRLAARMNLEKTVEPQRTQGSQRNHEFRAGSGSPRGDLNLIAKCLSLCSLRSSRFMNCRFWNETCTLEPTPTVPLPIQMKLALVTLALASAAALAPADPIDRHALVARHNLAWIDLRGQVPLGNGEFCFNADATGLRTFAGSTMSHWGWHSFPLPDGLTPGRVPATGTFQQGRLKGGDEFPAGTDALRTWMFDNPHIMNLARLGAGNELRCQPDWFFWRLAALLTRYRSLRICASLAPGEPPKPLRHLATLIYYRLLTAARGGRKGTE